MGYQRPLGIHIGEWRLQFGAELTIKARELTPLLRRSPSNLPIPARVVYTSSLTASRAKLNEQPLDDLQLLIHPASYSASKYMGELVMVQLDRDFNRASKKPGDARIRCLNADPGAITSSIFDKGLAGTFGPLASLMWFAYWLAFYLVRSA